jgi:hypothetical protein
MNKIIIKKLLVIPLLLGLVACSKVEEDDLLKRPDDFKIVRQLTTKEQYDVLLKMVAHRDKVSKLDMKLIAEERNLNQQTTIIQEFKGTDTIYKDGSFETNYVNEERMISKGVNFLPIVEKVQKTVILDDNKLYTVEKTDVNGVEDYNFDLQMLEGEALEEYVPDNVGWLLDTGMFIDEVMYLDDKGNYRLVGDYYEYIVEILDDGYNHNISAQYLVATFAKDGKLLSYYQEATERKQFLMSQARVNDEDVAIKSIFKMGVGVTYESKKDMPNKASKLADFPKAKIDTNLILYLDLYNTTISEGGNITVDDEEIIAYGQMYLSSHLNKKGECFGEVFSTNFIFIKSIAVNFKMNLWLKDFMADESENTTEFIHSIDISSGISDSLSDSIQVVTQNDKVYLVYTPQETQEDLISIAFGFDYFVGIEFIGGEPTYNIEITIENVSI